MKLDRIKLLYIMLSMTMAVDFLNGLFSSLHIGELFRVLLLLLCILTIKDYDRKKFANILLIFLFLIINILCSFILNSKALSYDLSIAMKSVMVFVISSAILALYKKGREINVGDIIRNNLVYGPALFILSNLLGISNSSYSFSGNAVGSKGSFLSLNTVNIALIILYTFAISQVILGKKRIAWAITSVYVSVPMIMLGTKTSIVMIVAIPVIVIFFNTRYGCLTV